MKQHMEKTTNTPEATKWGKTKKRFWGKPNLVATLLVVVFMFGGWYYLWEDLSLYSEAWYERAVLAENAEQAILYSAGTASIDLDKMEEEAEAINEKIQTLADKTDIGEYFAANDLTAEGRDTNKIVACGIYAIFAAGVIYLMMQVIHVVVFIAKSCSKDDNSKQGGAAA